MSARTLLILLTFLGLLAGGALAQTPAGLLLPAQESLTPPPERDWEKLGIRDWELRVLERFHRGGGHEGFHIAYKSVGLNITGVLTRPYIRDEKTKYPLIILNHGSTSGVSAPYREVALELARRGYVVLASTFRGQAGPEGQSEGIVEFAKGEVIDTLQLTQLGRKLEYVDTLRTGIVGFGHGATVTIQAIERSNVFRAAVAVSPPLFSGMAETGFIGMEILREKSEELFGRELPESVLIRELSARESFRNIPRIRTPLLLIASESDPSYLDQLRFVARLKERNTSHRFVEYPGMFPQLIPALSGGTQSDDWQVQRDAAWSELFGFLDEHVQLPVEAAAN